jgi:branched-chain amino acid transport system ATP-binding protein
VTPLLETRGLCRRFDGLEAVRSVDFRLEPGEVRALIGPNGAGKTTLVSLISGRLAPTAGRVFLRGRDITRLKAWTRVGLGIVYTFQVTSLYPRLTVAENVALAVQRGHLRRLGHWFRLDRDAVAAEVRTALEAVGLAARAAEPAGVLAYGHQRLLELAMALALHPVLLILDEPTQGLAPAEVEQFVALVRGRLAGAVTLLLIEHNLAVVLALAERVTVMDRGQILAEGSPAAIERDPEVQRVYLGR